MPRWNSCDSCTACQQAKDTMSSDVQRHLKLSLCIRMHTMHIAITCTKHLTPHLGVTVVSASCWVATLLMIHGLVVEPSSMEEGGEYSDLLRVEVATAEEISNVTKSV